MVTIPTVKLNDGNHMPQFGLGVLRIGNDATAEIVRTAVNAGYRLFDTAAAYGNEQGVGDGVRSSGVPRSDIFVTTKLRNLNQGDPRTAFDESMKQLGFDYLDLYLIHWPAPPQDLYVDAWRALATLKSEGRIKSIGVSNFQEVHLQRLFDETGVVPVLNQVELHPFFQQTALRAFHGKHGIITESWGPLGNGRAVTDPVVTEIARARGKTPAQIILRWHIQSGLMVIPKSATPSRIFENAQIFDFVLNMAEMTALASLDKADGRYGPDPYTFVKLP